MLIDVYHRRHQPVAWPEYRGIFVSKISLWIENIKRKLKYPDVEFDLTAYREWLNKVNSYDFSGLDDAGLMGISN